MNREQKRKLKSSLRKKGVTDEQIELLVRIKEQEELAGSIAEGAKVKLDIEAICGNPNWSRLTPQYREWVCTNAGKVFTVEYDEQRKENPSLVCLVEDETDPKWLFYVGDLKKV